MKFEPVIGLEIHAELRTKSKMFCGCSADHTSCLEPNLLICPVCTGLPGAMPVLNKKAEDQAILVGLALNCHINEVNRFARKNYFYPDLPKGYQISQFEYPVASNGWLDIQEKIEEPPERIRIRRVHLEEDTAKLSHQKDGTLVDFNRAGVPLLEIVTEPDMHSVESVLVFANKIRSILRYLEVNSGDMEKGVLRFEANISVRLIDNPGLNNRTEIKNLNSFQALAHASKYEINRQMDLIVKGNHVDQETLGWNEEEGRTYSQRGKEEAHDYRYFPEPDIPPILVDKDWIELISKQMPELPDARTHRFIEEYGFTEQETTLLISDKYFADYFEKVVSTSSSPVRTIFNWMVGEFTRQIHERRLDLLNITLHPEEFAQLIDLLNSNAINDYNAKEILNEMFETRKNATVILKEKNLLQILDEDFLSKIIIEIISKNPDLVKQYLNGKESLFQWFMGQVSRETKGKSNPKITSELLEKLLKEQ